MYRRALTTVLLVALTITSMAPVAGADQISDKRKQAAALAARLDDLQTRAEQLAEDYDEARYRAGQLDEQITQVSAVLDANRARIDEVEGRLGGWAVRAYVGATSTDPVLAMFQSGDPSLTFAGYAAIAVGADAELGDELRQSREDVTALEDELARAREDQQAEQEALASKKSAAEAAVRRSEGVLAGIQSDLAQLVAQEQRRLALEEQRRVQARLAAAAAARQKTVAGTNRVRASAPPPSPGAAGAVAQAMAMLGVRYRWGNDDPASGFDCSGLTSWAWARAGVSIPHSSRAQFSSTRAVQVEDLQPGDLVFFGSPVHHVGLYIGNGQMVHAPHSGDVVKVATIYRRDLRGGGRP